MKRLPMGCDQQGRHPEVSEFSAEPPNPKLTLVIVLACVALLAFLTLLGAP